MLSSRKFSNEGRVYKTP